MSRWDDLADKMTALDEAMGKTVHGPDGEVLGFVFEDWTPPLTTDVKAHVEYLERVYGHVRGAVDEASNFADDERKKAQRAARSAVDLAEDIAIDVAKTYGGTLLAPGLAPAIDAAEKASVLARSKAVRDKLGELKDDLTTVAGGYVITQGMVIVVALVGAAVYFSRERAA